MRKILLPNALYASGLLIAALSGSFIATATSARAQTAAPVAKSAVKLTSDIMVERVALNDKGEEVVTLKTPKQAVVVPGDKLIVSLHYVNESGEPAKEFRATNPISPAVQFIAVKEDWAEVSVDNGASWGPLSALTVVVPASEAAPASTRPAEAKDVTHVRWTFKTPLAPGQKGTVSFRGSIK
jgi:hypothetical protein